MYARVVRDELHSRRRQFFVCRFIVQHGQAHLLEVVAALHTASSLASCLHRWQQKTNQNADDRNDNEKFDESESLVYEKFFHGKSLVFAE